MTACIITNQQLGRHTNLIHDTTAFTSISVSAHLNRLHLCLDRAHQLALSSTKQVSAATSISCFPARHFIQATELKTPKSPQTHTMAFSPYTRHGRISNKVTLVWVGCFFALVFFFYYITTRHPDTARTYQDMLRKGPQKEPVAAGAV
ncbi:hypothetical protein NKR23_g4432 [Pleurostoma richardsiae]|uniref:Uncharacterized protein n=1 Tax=Pleurostoma richardsiae TaxID=41990 RepID=A0AA38VFZ1_9PEZI|nr:hypothetical protein NKR23_g4432 [Pleurostoma richardsiae]